MLHSLKLLTWCSALAVLVYGTLSWPRRVDSARAEVYGQNLRTLLALQVELGAEVMKVRSGLSTNFDGLVRIDHALKTFDRELIESPAFLPAKQRLELQSAVTKLEQARYDNMDLIEQFKSENAVLRNSIRFLPIAAADIDAAATRDGAAADFARAASALVRNVLLLYSWNDPSVVDTTQRQLDTLARAITDTPNAQRLELVLLHARTICEKSPVVDTLVRQILTWSAPLQTQALLARYARFHGAATARTNLDANILFGLALSCVLFGASAVIGRMRLSAAQLRHTTQQLELAVANLRVEQEKQRELSQLKSRFVSMTSHEFRTPLSAIMSSSEMLEAYDDKWPRAKKQLHFERIRSSVLGMTRMLDGILMIGRSEAGMLEFKPEPIDLRQFCAEAVDRAAQSCHNERVFMLESSIADALVMADEVLLGHVIDNLLSNAIKYSGPGSSVLLEVSCVADGIQLLVRDQGIGISELDQKHLFETFHRGSNVGAISGSGLGLSIVKRAVDLHGGSIEVQSAADSGTQFTVCLPCARSAA